MIVVHSPDDGFVLGLTIGFYVIVGLNFLGGILMAIEKEKSLFVSFFAGLGLAAMAVLIFGPFYADWMLGVLVGNLAGLPAADNAAFYWTYFVAKRLTMFSL